MISFPQRTVYPFGKTVLLFLQIFPENGLIFVILKLLREIVIIKSIIRIYDQKEDIKRYQILVGLSDSKTKVQKFATEQFEKIISNVCRGYHMAFSLSNMHGGYFYDDGFFSMENSITVTLLGVEDDAIVDEIAKDICAFFNQESVLVVQDMVECREIRNVIL